MQANDPAKRPPGPQAQRRSRMDELLAVGRSHWTASQHNELLNLVAQKWSGSPSSTRPAYVRGTVVGILVRRFTGVSIFGVARAPSACSVQSPRSGDNHPSLSGWQH